MKVGDLVLCPVDLETGEMYCGHKTLAMIDVVHEKEPRIGVIYLDTPVHVPMFERGSQKKWN